MTALEGINADHFAVLVLHSALGDDTAAVICIFVDGLDVTGFRDDLFCGSVVKVIHRGDCRAALGLDLGIHRAVVIEAVLDGVGGGDGAGGGINLIRLYILQGRTVVVVGIQSDLSGFDNGS